MTRPLCIFYHPELPDGCAREDCRSGPERGECLGCDEYRNGESFCGLTTYDILRREDWAAMWAPRVPVAHLRGQAGIIS